MGSVLRDRMRRADWRCPTVPVPDTIKECFKRAAQARIAYITAYGLAGGSLPSVAATPPTAQPVSPAPPAPATAPNATVGMCDEPPYGADPKLYKLYFDTLGKLANLSHDLFPNICRAKYKGDEKIRKALVDVGVTSYEIDHEDVAVIALKVLQEAEKFARSH